MAHKRVILRLFGAAHEAIRVLSCAGAGAVCGCRASFIHTEQALLLSLLPCGACCCHSLSSLSSSSSSLSLLLLLLLLLLRRRQKMRWSSQQTWKWVISALCWTRAMRRAAGVALRDGARW